MQRREPAAQHSLRIMRDPPASPPTRVPTFLSSSPAPARAAWRERSVTMNLPHWRLIRWIVFLLFTGSLLLQPIGESAATTFTAWIHQFGSTQDDDARAVAVDSSGNSVVV